MPVMLKPAALRSLVKLSTTEPLRSLSDKMQGLQNILLLFRNEFNKFNNTGAEMLDSIYHMALRLIKNTFLA